MGCVTHQRPTLEEHQSPSSKEKANPNQKVSLLVHLKNGSVVGRKEQKRENTKGQVNFFLSFFFFCGFFLGNFLLLKTFP